MLSEAFGDLFARVIVGTFEVYDDVCKLSEKIRNRYATAWANLTRPLAPTPEEATAEKLAEQQRRLIAQLNQDTNQYTAETWWAEYHQARNLNVN